METKEDPQNLWGRVRDFVYDPVDGYTHLAPFFVLGGVFLVFVLFALNVTEEELAAARHFANASQHARTFFEQLGTPARGAIACRRDGTVVYCDAVIGDVPVTVICANTCRFPTPTR